MNFIKKLLTIINLLRFYQEIVNISRRKSEMAKSFPLECLLFELLFLFDIQ